jgi:hypothetical protein
MSNPKCEPHPGSAERHAMIAMFVDAEVERMRSEQWLAEAAETARATSTSTSTSEKTFVTRPTQRLRFGLDRSMLHVVAGIVFVAFTTVFLWAHFGL